jgi:hypothetical protein
MSAPFDLIVTNDKQQVLDLIDMGYCPVECSIDGESLVDSLEMDHHGVRSDLEGVAVRAYRDHFGARKDDPRFVIVGVADADATFAVAALAGLLPHPSRAEEFAHLPPHLQAVHTADVSALAALVNKVDTDPIGIDLAAHEQGPKLLLWNAAYGGGRTSLQGFAGVDGWRRILTGAPFAVGPLLEAARTTEAARREAAKKDLTERGTTTGKVGAILDSRAWGFDVWYGRTEEADPNIPAGWERPVVAALAEGNGSITLGCPNKAVAEALFGPGGLMNVFERLPGGWGGREAIGGSPRGQEMTADDLAEVVRTLNEMMN